MPTREHSFDYVVVGAGSAGCVLARRLSEDADARVLLIEAGGWDRDPWISIPLGWGRILQHRLHDWGYFSEPADGVGGRSVECARGKVIGGSSSINAMAYVRGHRGDFERWAASGLKGWSHAHVLPYFRMQEAWQGSASRLRGDVGPLTVRESTYRDPLIDAFIAAGVAAGYPRTADYNAGEQEGFGLLQSTIRNGRRCSAADAYLRPALARSNLRVVVNALVTRVILERGRAVGVEYAQRGRLHVARAGREVILSAGVINSPQLLMLSGIGDPDELRTYGISVQAALPGVGKNLQDHVSVSVAFSRSSPGPLHRQMRADRIVRALASAYLFGKGFASDLPSGYVAFLKTRPELPMPDIQLLSNAGPITATPYLPPFRRAFADGFSCRPVLLRPQSRGEVRLASAEPARPARIHQNFLATGHDRSGLREGVRLVREIARHAPLAPFIAAELAPGAAKQSDTDLDAWIGATALTAHHPCGTCKMGTLDDAMAVVDEELRVRGVQGLRVVDASVMPDLVGGNINAAVTMIAERAADLIRGRSTLPAEAAVPADDARAAAGTRWFAGI